MLSSCIGNQRVPKNKCIMVKGLLAWIGLVFKVFKSFSFSSFSNFVKYDIYTSHHNNGKIGPQIKQKNQSAQKNVNLFLLNTRGKTKMEKILSWSFGVTEWNLGILEQEFYCSNLNLNLNITEKFHGYV